MSEFSGRGIECLPQEYCVRSNNAGLAHVVWKSKCTVFEPDYFVRKMASVYACTCLAHTICCNLCGNKFSGWAGYDANNIFIMNHLIACRRNITIVGLFLRLQDDSKFNLHQLLRRSPQLIYFDIDYLGILSKLDDVDSAEEFIQYTNLSELRCFRCEFVFDSLPATEVLKKHISDCENKHG